MGTEKKPPRQFHIRIDEDAAAAVVERAAQMGVSVNDWLTRAVLHGIEHAKASGEPKPLQLPWTALL